MYPKDLTTNRLKTVPYGIFTAINVKLASSSFMNAKRIE